ncbi:MAG: DNA-binding protein [Pseudobdellovibrionaceae bacterium]|nr:DNA-binding protein [Pseudobdellovibrionaceae bacterium]
MTTDRRILSPRVTYEEAKPVIEGLIAAGKPRPSALDLYNAMKRGSVTTLQKHVDRFREGQPRKTSALVMSQESQEFYLRDMQRHVDEAKKELEADLLELKQEKSTIVEESERFQAELLDLTSRHETASSQLQQKLGVIDQLQTEITRLRNLEDSMRESARQEIAAAQEAASKSLAEAMKKTDGDIKAVMDTAEQFRIAAETARTELARAQSKLEAMAGLEDENKSLRGVMKTLEGKIQQAEREAAVSSEKASSLSERLTDLQKTLGEQLPKLEVENKRLLKTIDDQRVLVQKAEQASAIADEKIRSMEQRLQDAQALAQERQNLLESALQEAKVQINTLAKNADGDKKHIDTLLGNEAEHRKKLGEAEDKVRSLEERIKQLTPADPKKK